MRSTDVDVRKDGYAYCSECKKRIWKVPRYEEWKRGGYKPTAQTLLLAAHLTHLEKEHKGEENIK